MGVGEELMEGALFLGHDGGWSEESMVHERMLQIIGPCGSVGLTRPLKVHSCIVELSPR